MNMAASRANCATPGARAGKQGATHPNGATPTASTVPAKTMKAIRTGMCVL
jgi:hypothetical protein